MMRFTRYLGILCLIAAFPFFSVAAAFSAVDFVNREISKDSTRLAIETQSRKVWKRSLILPGWGQYTNGGLWWIKIPVIYGGFVTGVLIYNFNDNYYREYLAEAQYRIKHNNGAPPWSPIQRRPGEQTTTVIIGAKDAYRRNRDLTILLMAGWYGLNAIEAYVSDMLKNRWNINESLTARVAPAVISMPGTESYLSAIGLKVRIGFE